MSSENRKWKVTYWMRYKPKSKPTIAYKIVSGLSELDAKKNADLYPPIIIKVDPI